MTMLLWGAFLVLVLVFLALDLGVFNREVKTITIKAALIWTAIWITCSLVFNVGIYFLYEADVAGLASNSGLDGWTASVQYLTGYVVEKSLSLDNVFVIAMIFAYFRIPSQFQHRVLFWGVLGALVLRGAMIAAGTALIRTFDWTVYVFGGLLFVSAIKMMTTDESSIEPNKSLAVRAVRRLYPVSPDLDGHHFFTRIDGRLFVTPLFVVLLVVESSDVLFAVDSIPAIFAVTQDPFLVFTSNVFAILGLRSLYFAIAGLMDRFQYIKMSLVFVLAFVGVKMCLVHHYQFPTWVSLSVIVGILATGILASLKAPPPHKRQPVPDDAPSEG